MFENLKKIIARNLILKLSNLKKFFEIKTRIFNLAIKDNLFEKQKKKNIQ